MRKFLCMLAPITTCSAQWFGSLGLTIGAQNKPDKTPPTAKEILYNDQVSPTMGFDLSFGYEQPLANHILALRPYLYLTNYHQLNRSYGKDHSPQPYIFTTKVGVGLNLLLNVITNMNSNNLFSLGIFTGALGVENNYTQGRDFIYNWNLDLNAGIEIRYQNSAIRVGGYIPMFPQYLKINNNPILNNYQNFHIFINYAHYF
ncbi:hypothetical protein NHP200010_11710 [Helicobacter bizzozeronii]|uniref:hypothetical protein n=1 Tax=Helicobacter bizzozeronii TaxID=56877 RepID=UPI00244D88F9|nr:hypothetical protein [Helicobacter bizzozeronii]GMB93451.1 hypothetical protein NHP200010_11710 [Helicobacter bizzozeronii]